jgi:hypothetical protein
MIIEEAKAVKAALHPVDLQRIRTGDNRSGTVDDEQR